MWDEMVPPPTRKVAVRLTVTYAGFEGESKLLEALYKRAMDGEEIAPSLHRAPGLLAAWHHEPIAPWQTDEWIEQMRQQLRPNAFLRQIENRFVTNESSFVDMDWWDACIDPGLRPVVADRRVQAWLGVDASTKRDSTAIVACTWDEDSKKVKMLWHRIFQPSKTDPLDFEATIERTLIECQARFEVREVRFDPYQMQAVSQRLLKAGLPMVEFPQSVPNLTEASTNLYELVKGCNLAVYNDAEVRTCVSRCVAIETSRGWRIAKEKISHKIDVIVALAQAALGAVKFGQAGDPGILAYYRDLSLGKIRLDADNSLTDEYNEALAELNGSDRCQGCRQPIKSGLSIDSGPLGRWHDACYGRPTVEDVAPSPEYDPVGPQYGYRAGIQQAIGVAFDQILRGR